MRIRGIEGRNIVDDGEDRGDFVRRLGGLATASGTAVFAREGGLAVRSSIKAKNLVTLPTLLNSFRVANFGGVTVK